MIENDLYVKLEKYKQKIRVVIELDKIKIEEEKIKRMLNWLVSKEVEDIQKFLEPTNYYWQFIKDFMFMARLIYDLLYYTI